MRRPDPEPTRSEAPTAEPEALLLAVVHTIADAVITADEDGRITMWTGGAEALFGWPSQEILGLQVTTLVPEQHRDAHTAGLRRVLGGGEQHVIGRGAVELTALRRDGSEFPAELTLTAGLHRGRRYFAAVVRDVSARHAADTTLREVLADLERSNAELQQFASVASHDLNEPLRIVEGYLGLLRRRYGDRLDADADEFIEHTITAVHRMQRLIDDLLRYARAGAEATRSEPVDLHAVAVEVLETLGAAIAESGAQITLHELPTVTGDDALLRQVFQNLIANALKFSHAGQAPRVDVRARRLSRSWEISVADRGIGVDPEATVRIFEMFGRGRGTGHGRAGSGIGLAICKRAVEAHGGAIRVQPVPGGGADFRFILPDPEPA